MARANKEFYLKDKLVDFVKYNKGIYALYFYLCSGAIRILRLFVPGKKKMILFMCFGGKKYDDSPRAIYEAMAQDARYAEYELVWAFREPDKFIIPKGRKVKADTFAFYKAALQAGCWITNTAIERGLSFKSRHTLYVNTWHGTPIKTIGTDIPSSGKAFQMKTRLKYDVVLAQGSYDAAIFEQAFGLPSDTIQITGLPRNDVLAEGRDRQAELKRKFGIKQDQKVILYAPTFREYEKESGFVCVTRPPINLAAWQARLGRDYVLLLRAHHEAARVILADVEKESSFIYNVSAYPDIQELFLMADVLVSDYSSVFFDYAITGRPMLSYAYDYERYAGERGMYLDIREEIAWASEEEEVLQWLEEIREPEREEEEKQRTSRFCKKYVEAYGHSTEKVLDYIANFR